MSDPVVYLLDANDCILPQGKGWDYFADRNGSPEVMAESVAGKSIWQFFQGKSTTTFWQWIFGHVRRTQKPLELSYRCDGPDCKRHMAMTITPKPDRCLLVQNDLVKEEPMTEHAVFLSQQVKPSDILERCSMCNSVRYGKQWGELSDHLAAGLELNPDRELVVAYSICEHCKRKMGHQLADSCKNTENR